MKTLKSSLLALLLVAVSALAFAEGEQSASPLQQGPYIAAMGSYVITRDKAFSAGYGGMLSGGYRKGQWAIEAAGRYEHYQGTGAEGGLIAGLVFPLKSLPNLYGVIGFGGLDIKSHPVIHRGYSLTTSEAGAGYIFPLSVGNYEFGLRADARYRYGHRESRVQPDGDLPIAKDFQDVLINIGLQLPLGFKPVTVAPLVAVVAVVPSAVVAPAPQCSDGLDNDGDGKIDYPADPGCSSADDNDETDPPPPPCMPPESGEKISLKGCGTGDIIILHGVNFEFDKASLTLNAKTILDGVATELLTYPDIKVELSGHTDAKGSHSYNLRLSDQRAASVLKYLGSKGVAKQRMTSIGYGETKPVADNATDAGRELNRRVELKITSSSAATPVVTAPTPLATTAPAPATPAGSKPATQTAPAPTAAPKPDELDSLIGK